MTVDAPAPAQWKNAANSPATRLPAMPASSPVGPGGSADHCETPPTQPHLLVWAGNFAQAEALVRHAAQLVSATQMPWTVICVETPGTGRASPPALAHATRALRLAEDLGAATAALHAESVISAVVEHARRVRASMVLIGGHAPDGWLDGLQRPWLGNLADALSVRLPGVAINVVRFPDESVEERAADARAPARDARWRGWSNAVAVVALCTLVSEAFEPYIEHASAATIYLAGVVYVALRLGQSAAMFAVVLSILAFDLLVVEPRWSFKPTDTQYYFTFLVMLIVGMLISRLAEQVREQASVAEARARRAQALNELASHLVSAQSEQDVGDGLAMAAHTTFGVPSALLLPDDLGRLVDQAGFCRPTTAGAAETALCDELTLAQQAFDEGRRIETACAPPEPEQLLCLPLPSANGTLGVFAIRLPASRSGLPEDRRLLDAFADQAALALERSLFQRRSAAAVLDAESERLRSTVLSGISHDFRTPLTTIIGAATSLLDQSDALDELRRTRLQQSILDEARRMHGSMSDLLDLTRMEEGAVQVCCEWCPADDLIDEAFQTLTARLQARTVKVQVPPETVVWCDARLVVQVLVNLLDNALRHTPTHCTIGIDIALADDVWRLTVADDGPGLPAGQEGEVFKKFFRTRSEPADAGTGLGLAICAAVARLHRGTIVAVNDGGARFTLTLPQPAAPNASIDEAS